MVDSGEQLPKLTSTTKYHRVRKYHHAAELAPMEACCRAGRLTMPPLPGSNVSCQSPQAFLPPTPTLMDLLHIKSLNIGDNRLT